MNPILQTGLLIGTLCGIWTLVMGWTGWYKDPALMRAFFLVIPIEVGGLVWGLRKTAAEGRGLGGQIVAGTMMSIVAGVVVIVFSLLFTTVLFPESFDELESTYRTILQQQGKSEAEIDQEVQVAMAAAAPMNYALQGFLGTLITGILASGLLAPVLRARPHRPSEGAGREHSRGPSDQPAPRSKPPGGGQ
jgi:TM2 domain-containing membrane protein YozV